MEKSVFDFALNAFIDFHRAIGLLVMMCLLLWMMSGRRLEPGAYMTFFIKLVRWIIKHLFKACEGAAKGTASSVPAKHARWRPLIRFGSQFLYVALTVLTVVLIVGRCAQTHS